MSAHINLLIEHPSPIGRDQSSLTTIFQTVFEERVLLRTLPLLSEIEETPVSLVLSPAAIECLSKTNWVQTVEDALSRIDRLEPKLRDLLFVALGILKSHDGSILSYYLELAERKRLSFVARTLEGIDLACWVSTPGILDFTFNSIQKVFEAYLGRRAEQISLMGCGYTPLLDAILHDTGFKTVYVDNQAYVGAQSKLPFGVHRPVLNPTNGVALCGVDDGWALTPEFASDELRSEWRHTHSRAVIRDESIGLSQECIPTHQGVARPYDLARGVAAARKFGREHMNRLRAKLVRRKQFDGHSFTTILLPDASVMWCEEVDACLSLIQRGGEIDIAADTAPEYLSRFPEQDAAWLGPTISDAMDQIGQLWLPRRVSRLYERYRRFEMGHLPSVANDDLEFVARLFLFSQVSMRFFGECASLSFLVDQTPSSLLDAAERRLTDGVAFTQTADTEEGLTPLYTWASNAYLVQAS